jgi:hypothetical protein
MVWCSSGGHAGRAGHAAALLRVRGVPVGDVRVCVPGPAGAPGSPAARPATPGGAAGRRGPAGAAAPLGGLPPQRRGSGPRGRRACTVLLGAAAASLCMLPGPCFPAGLQWRAHSSLTSASPARAAGPLCRAAEGMRSGYGPSGYGPSGYQGFRARPAQAPGAPAEPDRHRLGPDADGHPAVPARARRQHFPALRAAQPAPRAAAAAEPAGAPRPPRPPRPLCARSCRIRTCVALRKAAALLPCQQAAWWASAAPGRWPCAAVPQPQRGSGAAE